MGNLTPAMNIGNIGGMGGVNMSMANMANIGLGNVAMNNFGIGIPGGPQQQGMVRGGPPGIHRRTPSGTIVQGAAGSGQGVALNYEMLQSFIQRNPEGGGPPNGSLGGMA